MSHGSSQVSLLSGRESMIKCRSAGLGLAHGRSALRTSLKNNFYQSSTVKISPILPIELTTTTGKFCHVEHDASGVRH